jgi:hypothetical protein
MAQQYTAIRASIVMPDFLAQGLTEAHVAYLDKYARLVGRALSITLAKFD